MNFRIDQIDEISTLATKYIKEEFEFHEMEENPPRITPGMARNVIKACLSISDSNAKMQSKIHKEIATRLFMTATTFSKTYNISRATVSGWGNGKNISPDHCKILSNLGISREAIENPSKKD